MFLDFFTIMSKENREEEKEVRLDMEFFESKMGVFPIIEKEPFVLHLSNVENRELLIRGKLDVTVSIPCARCLTEVPTRLHLEIDKEIPISQITDAGQADGDHFEKPGYVDGHQLDVDRLAYEEMLVVWPMHVLCKEDCKGLCSQCGANLNKKACSCEKKVVDPRMAAFQDVFNKFKEV